MATNKTLELRAIKHDKYYPPLKDKDDARIIHTFGGTYLKTQHGQLVNIGAEANGRTKKRIKKYKARLYRQYLKTGLSAADNNPSPSIPSAPLGIQEGSRVEGQSSAGTGDSGDSSSTNP